jgi:hypothetical protein
MPLGSEFTLGVIGHREAPRVSGSKLGSPLTELIR